MIINMLKAIQKMLLIEDNDEAIFVKVICARTMLEEVIKSMEIVESRKTLAEALGVKPEPEKSDTVTDPDDKLINSVYLGVPVVWKVIQEWQKAFGNWRDMLKWCKRNNYTGASFTVPLETKGSDPKKFGQWVSHQMKEN